jgi:Protein of unknown function (DUF2924)
LEDKTMSMAKQLAALKHLGVCALRTRYAEVFGEETRAGNKTWLLKRVAWRMQALEEGDLSERARQRAAELANDADLRLSPPRVPEPPTESGPTGGTQVTDISLTMDHRLPPPGTILTRAYKGQALQVMVLQNGFEYEGQTYRTLSALAKAITGSHCNGFLFFGLIKKGSEQ